VPLFGHLIEIERPHGTLTPKETGVTREQYEDLCRDIRFRMYKECFQLEAQTGREECRNVVMIGHHEDDRDENRLSELAKGNLVRIDGMMRWTRQSDVDVLRPLLHVRKHKLFELASQLHLFYMHDSTPHWSKRGWTRRVLDSNNAIDATESILPSLKALGAASEHFGDMLDERLLAWKKGAVSTFQHEGREIASFNIASIMSIAEELDESMQNLVTLALQMADRWNPMFQAYAYDYPDVTCPIQPIQLDRNLDLGALLFSRAFYSTQMDPKVCKVTEGVVAARRALNHCWASVSRSRLGVLHGRLHKQIPFVYRKADNMLFFTSSSGEAILKKDCNLFSAA